MVRSLTASNCPAQQMLSTSEVAELFGRSPRTIRDWIARGLLRPVRVGRSVFILKAHVDALLTGSRVTEHDPNAAADPESSQGYAGNSKSIGK